MSFLKSILPNPVKRLSRRFLRQPVLGPEPYGGPENSSLTFVAVCRYGFNFGIPNANSTFRLGLCRGFSQIGVRYQLVDVFNLERALPKLTRPFVMLSGYDYHDLS